MLEQNMSLEKMLLEGVTGAETSGEMRVLGARLPPKPGSESMAKASMLPLIRLRTAVRLHRREELTGPI